MRPAALTLALSVVIGLVIGVGGYAFVYAKGYSYLLNNPSACANCHVMRGQFDAWIKSSHRSAATCNDCHTPHNFFGKYAVKATNGFFHSFYFTTGRYPDNIEITSFDRKVTENACRNCHQNIVQAIDAGAENVHGQARGIECTRCHYSVGHSEAAASITPNAIPPAGMIAPQESAPAGVHPPQSAQNRRSSGIPVPVPHNPRPLGRNYVARN